MNLNQYDAEIGAANGIALHPMIVAPLCSG